MALIACLAAVAVSCKSEPSPFLPSTPTPSPIPGATATPVSWVSAQRGEAVFTSAGCVACHSTGSNTIIGPGLAGVGERAASRKPGLTADDYIEESIKTPAAYVVDGFIPLMPTNFAQTLSEDDIGSLVLYLKTLH